MRLREVIQLNNQLSNDELRQLLGLLESNPNEFMTKYNEEGQVGPYHFALEFASIRVANEVDIHLRNHKLHIPRE